jgi:hypothetical protein
VSDNLEFFVTLLVRQVWFSAFFFGWLEREFWAGGREAFFSFSLI